MVCLYVFVLPKNWKFSIRKIIYSIWIEQPDNINPQDVFTKNNKRRQDFRNFKKRKRRKNRHEFRKKALLTISVDMSEN